MYWVWEVQLWMNRYTAAVAKTERGYFRFSKYFLKGIGSEFSISRNKIEKVSTVAPENRGVGAYFHDELAGVAHHEAESGQSKHEDQQVPHQSPEKKGRHAYPEHPRV